MERKAILFVVVVIIVLAAVYLAFPALFNFSRFTKEPVVNKPVITEFFLRLDPATSTLAWVAGNYNGSINFRFGEIGRDEAGKVAGVFAVDMTSFKASDVAAESKLKSKEFFDAERFTNAELAVTELNYFGPEFISANEQVEKYELAGDLTIKGVTQRVKVPLLLKIIEGQVVATGEFTISREQFLLGPKANNLPNEVKVTVKLVSKMPEQLNN